MKEGLIGVLPGVLNQCNGDVEKCWGELTADACSLNLLKVGGA